eukprot:TRINITY_DN87278_c0_g1_i1.p1 TRINITY_DN87278_c0_g1~~TRINITY_DN87278_c0_g1_i1.p1  ORF type:complete len:677 (+),score=74.75 TRINITY_DN87278_c0_g1_i1:98-2128(+)
MACLMHVASSWRLHRVTGESRVWFPSEVLQDKTAPLRRETGGIPTQKIMFNSLALGFVTCAQLRRLGKTCYGSAKHFANTRRAVATDSSVSQASTSRADTKERKHAVALRLLLEQMENPKSDAPLCVNANVLQQSAHPGRNRTLKADFCETDASATPATAQRADSESAASFEPPLKAPVVDAVTPAEAEPSYLRPIAAPYIPVGTESSLVSTDDYQRTSVYGPDGRPYAESPVVDCRGWDTANESEQRQLLESALARLKESGYVVLENLLPEDRLREACDEYRRYRARLPYGVQFARMRAKRDMTIPPCEGIFKEDWLVRHPLVMAALARHVRNSTDTRNDAAAQLEIAQWVAGGGSIDHFQKGPASAGYPVLDLMVIIDTPGGAPAQTRHRDTILPGPCASLGVHIPLTQLQLEPLNGPIGFTPRSHRTFGDDAPKKDVIGAVPLGSVILYDSFTEHHGLENKSSNPRAALFSWYRCPGVYSGHTDENFGETGWKYTMQFRRHIQPTLVKAIDAEWRNCPSGAVAKEDSLFSRHDAALAEWGEEKVCFGCNCTTGSGRAHEKRWFCEQCWSQSSSRGQVAPEPLPENVAPPFPDADGLSAEWIIEQEQKGMNVRPSRGRHKLTLLRERGLFLPHDPSREWLATISTEPQPENWKRALRDGAARHANPSLPRHDGF